MKGVALRTERLLVRDLPPRAAGRVARFHRENWDFHRRWEPHRHPRYFEAGSQRRIIAAERRSKEMLHLWLLLRGRQRRLPLIGSITLSSIVRGFFQSCYLGYKMDERYVRQGYMREALAAVLDYAFSTEGLHRVEANVMPANRASRGLLEAIGFREEGVARDYLRIQGRWEDHVHMVMLRNEWGPAASDGSTRDGTRHENAARG
ncbi:MAG: GNAT family N-acetyltransferase [Spirochaetota bacterium]